MPERVTINEVADLAETSIATVSNYLNDKHGKMSARTRENIRRVIEETGYVPGVQARCLAGKPTKLIAVLILDNTNLWAGQVARGIEAVATAAGYQTVLCNSNFDPEREHDYLEKMLSLGVDGFIVQPTTNFREVQERITKAGRPIVFYDCNPFTLATSWVKSNLYEGIYTAISKCVERGYEEFVIAGSTPAASYARTHTRAERQQAFLDALMAKGIPWQELQMEQNSPSDAGLAEWFRLKLHPARRTLVFVPNQWALERVYRALMEQPQLIPEKVGLLGLNNANWARLTTPSISTIVEPVEEVGRKACSLLLEKLDDATAAPHQELLPCEVQWRETTR